MQQTTQDRDAPGSLAPRRPALMAEDPRVCFYVAGAVVSASSRRWSIDAVAAASIDGRVRRAVEAAVRGMYPYVPELDVALRRPETAGELERADSRFLLEWLRCLGEEKGQARSLSALGALTLSVKDGTLVYESAKKPGEPQRAALEAAGALLSDWLGRPVRVMDGTVREEEPSARAGEQAPAPAPERRFSRRNANCPIAGAAEPMGGLAENSGEVVVEGEIIRTDHKRTKAGRSLYIFDMTDQTGSVTAKMFGPDKGDDPKLAALFQEGSTVRVAGEWVYDDFSREMTLRVRQAEAATKVLREDDAPVKRVELHLHTQMSAMDGLTPLDELIRQAARWGHRAVAVTDHGVVQAFPDAAALGEKHGVKIILGMEAYVTGTRLLAVHDANDGPLGQPYVVLDIETTGLSPSQDAVTEIAAVRFENGRRTGEFQTFVNPGRPIPPAVVHLTGITDEMVREAPDIGEALRRFAQFAGTCALVAHNAEFDMGFIRRNARDTGVSFDRSVVDTLSMSQALYPSMRSHRLNALCKKLGVSLEGHHRAVHDATATAGILGVMLRELSDRGVERLSDVNGALAGESAQGGQAHHATLLVRNRTGLMNLYQMVSESHMRHLHRGKPRIPKSLLEQRREGLLVGSACGSGELYQAILRGEEKKRVDRIVTFYDYLEIQPLGNNEFMIRDGTVRGRDDLVRINERILELGKRHGKPVVATGDVHFLNPGDEVYRRILMHGQKFEDADNQAPLYFRTTGEMLDEFAYLAPADRRAVVVDNPAALCELIENVDPLPPYRLYPPQIESARDDIVRMTYRRAHELYGDPPPRPVASRLKKELDAITGYNFSVLYLIAHKLVKKSLEDGYLVGSRGSTGSSLVGFMAGITEVNPLAPHYLCAGCRYSDFDVDARLSPCGPDLPDRDCPRCGRRLGKNGYDIPFEVFLGFKGDKVPDIDLNFSGEYQQRAHEYTEVLLGKGNVFKAGTIGTIAGKTAYGFVHSYLEEKGLTLPRAETERLVRGCTGVKRTTGQHPGGIVVIPAEYDVHEFTPIQYPADDQESGVVTTHFTFDQLHDRLVKLDILGHDDPTALRMLQDLTGVDPRSIPLDDADTMRIFSSTDPLGVKAEELGCATGALGIPEFGTPFVRQMLEETRPTTIAELIRISGLSHGTDVWLGNARELIAGGVATLREVICTRDDIMNALIAVGVPAKMAFDTMESVRKGKGLRPEMEEAMRERRVPDWFVDSCRKIKYMFPKAHAAAYVMMAFRIAYFKVHYPDAYYATYFTVRADDFDAGLMLGSVDEIRRHLQKYAGMGKLNAKDKGIVILLEIALEMNLRGIRFTHVDLYRSDAARFVITGDGIRPPLTALPGLGAAAAQSIVEGRAAGPFMSVEDMRQRTRVSKAVVDILAQYRCLGGLPETNQMSLFDTLGL